MKTLQILTVCTAAIVMSACGTDTPYLLDENILDAHSGAVTSVLVVVNDEVFHSPLLGTTGTAYLTGLRRGIQEALPNVPTSFVNIDWTERPAPIPAIVHKRAPESCAPAFHSSRYATWYFAG
jgi:hypothetical protein